MKEIPDPPGSEHYWMGFDSGQYHARNMWIPFDPRYDETTPPIDTRLIGLWISDHDENPQTTVHCFMAYEGETGELQFETTDGKQTPLTHPDQWVPVPDLNRAPVLNTEPPTNWN